MCTHMRVCVLGGCLSRKFRVKSFLKVVLPLVLPWSIFTVVIKWDRDRPGFLTATFWGKIKVFFLSHFLFFSFFLFYFLNLFLESGEGKEKERERNISVWLPLLYHQPGTWPATQACALTRNQISHPLVFRPALNPLKHTSQGLRGSFLNGIGVNTRGHNKS